MSEPFLAEVRIMAFDFAPRGWAACDGQILPIAQNQSLYSLLGTAYGGDGRTSFALPDLRGRAPLHVGSGHLLGQRGGEETHTLSTAELANHNHRLQASTVAGVQPIPVDSVLAQTTATDQIYAGASNVENMNTGAVGNTGGGQAHNNMQPFLALNYVIALQGLFPSRN